MKTKNEKLKSKNYNLKLKAFFIAVIFLFLSWPGQAKAAFSFKIESINPTSVASKTDEVQVMLTITDLPSESYFKIAWQEKDGASYFGYMKNSDGNWTKIKSLSEDKLGDTCANYFKVTDQSKTTLTLVTKIGEDQELSNNNYFIKAHRFTKSCDSNESATNSIGITVNLPTATPTPTPTPTQETESSITLTLTPMPAAATTTPKPTSTATMTPTTKPTPKPTPTPTEKAEEKILGEETVGETSFVLSSLDEKPTPEEEKASEEKGGIKQNLPKIMIGAGGLLILVALISFLAPFLKLKLKKPRGNDIIGPRNEL